jgi:FeS assembly SUF system regulator
MIKLGRLTDYAVTLLTQMVSEEQAVWAASDLAEKTGLSMATTSKILKQLTKSGILGAQRGAAGGYRLNQAASIITIAAIVEAMDGPIALTDCAEGGSHTCNVEKMCPMSGNWDRINRAVRRALDEVSLADMAIPHHKRPAPLDLDPVLHAASQ